MGGDGLEFSPMDMESNEETAEMIFAKRRRCFCIPCFGSSNRSSPTVGLNWWHKIRTAESDEGLWARGVIAVKKLREWSEIVAGPRWKTFIRRFNRTKSGGGGGSRHAKFQYDPLSYALNFDEGPGQNGNSDEDDDHRFRNFSARYVTTVPVSTNSSVDMGKDGPSFS